MHSAIWLRIRRTADDVRPIEYWKPDVRSGYGAYIHPWCPILHFSAIERRAEHFAPFSIRHLTEYSFNCRVQQVMSRSINSVDLGELVRALYLCQGVLQLVFRQSHSCSVGPRKCHILIRLDFTSEVNDRLFWNNMSVPISPIICRSVPLVRIISPDFQLCRCAASITIHSPLALIYEIVHRSCRCRCQLNDETREVGKA